MTQPRQPVGARQGDDTAGGRYTHKTVPNLKPGRDLCFNNDTGVGPPHDWDQRVMRVGNTRATFTRVVETGDEGEGVVTITTDCDPPDMLFLARKGDVDYWSAGNWRRRRKDRRTWTADIAVNMLRQGLVSTGYDQFNYDGGLRAVVDAGGKEKPGYEHRLGAISLTYGVAQIRTLRLLQSMTNNAPRWHTILGGARIPSGVDSLLQQHFESVAELYRRLPQPPWRDPPCVPWGPQTVAGHATTIFGSDVFVGEHGDLMWRALTETDQHGRSPLKTGLINIYRYNTMTDDAKDMVTAAVLYDDTAARQLTHGLFDGVPDPDDRQQFRTSVLEAFNEALNPPDGRECRWTVEQQTKLAGFVETVEASQPETVDQVP